jgi:hypothetical protein
VGLAQEVYRVSPTARADRAARAGSARTTVAEGAE